jgi:hypothetical protein
MSFQITNAHRVTYRSNVELALQQKKAKLAPYITWASYDGEKSKIKDLVGSVKPNRGRTRHGDTNYNNTPHDGRWIAPGDEYYYADLVDKADKFLAPGIDITGMYTMAAAATLARADDDAFLEGFYGNALAGKEGATVLPFAPANIIAVNTGAAAPTGLNIPKLRKARAMFVANLVDTDEEELYMAVTSTQTDNLLSELQATSAEFTDSRQAPVLESGKLRKLLGFNFVECEIGNAASFDNAGLTLDGSGYRRVPAWCKSGISGGTFGEPLMSIDPLPQKRHSVQVYAGKFVTVTRNDEAKAIQVLCAE